MQCKCGNEIDNVPEHLRDLATWMCAKCTNASAKSEPTLEQVEDEQIARRVVNRPQKAA